MPITKTSHFSAPLIDKRSNKPKMTLGLNRRRQQPNTWTESIDQWRIRSWFFSSAEMSTGHEKNTTSTNIKSKTRDLITISGRFPRVTGGQLLMFKLWSVSTGWSKTLFRRTCCGLLLTTTRSRSAPTQPVVRTTTWPRTSVMLFSCNKQLLISAYRSYPAWFIPSTSQKEDRNVCGFL